MEKSIGLTKYLQDDSHGRIIFLPATNKDYIYFVPRTHDLSLKILENSMWSDKEVPTYGMVYRASTCIEAIEWLRDNVGKLSLSKPVHEWMKAASAVFPIDPIPDLPLYDFQREGVGFLWRRPRAMLSFSPGLGKTIVSITAASLLSQVKKILVIAPASLLFMWKAELEKWDEFLPYKPIAYVWKRESSISLNIKDIDQDSKLWIITNPESVIKNEEYFIDEKFDLLILDESIYYKSRRSQRTKSMLHLGKYIPRVWELTGAPATRMVDDLWSQFHILNPKAYRSYWRFADNYCLVDNTPWAKTIAANKKDTEEVIKRRFRDIYFARSQEEVLDLPDWLFTDIDIPMTLQQEKNYREMATNLYSEFSNEEDLTRTVSVDSHLAKIVRLIQIASNPTLLDGKNSSGKWEALPELFLQFDPPYIIWTTFVKTAHYMKTKMQGLGLRTKIMIGETLPKDRQSTVEEFQDNKLDALILGISVGSFGHTLTAAKTAFYLERDFDGSYFQSLHRVRRIGTTHSPNIVHMRSIYRNGSATVDSLVHSMLDYRVGMIQRLTIGMVLDALR